MLRLARRKHATAGASALGMVPVLALLVTLLLGGMGYDGASSFLAEGHLVPGASTLPRTSSTPLITYTSLSSIAGGGYGVAFDAYHSTFDVVSKDGLTAIKEGSWTVAGSVATPLGEYCRVAVDSGRQLAFVSRGTLGGVTEINTTSLAIVRNLTTDGASEGLAVDPSLALLLYTDQSALHFYDYASQTELGSVPIVASRVAIDPADHIVAASSQGSPVAWLLSETTREMFGNTTDVPSTLPLAYVPSMQEFIAGSNSNGRWLSFPAATPGGGTSSDISTMTNLQDMVAVGDGSNEALVWGNSELAVVDVQNMSVVQQVHPQGGLGFPYGIAVDPSTGFAMGVDPVTGADYPFAPSGWGNQSSAGTVPPSGSPSPSAGGSTNSGLEIAVVVVALASAGVAVGLWLRGRGQRKLGGVTTRPTSGPSAAGSQNGALGRPPYPHVEGTSPQLASSEPWPPPPPPGSWPPPP